MSAANRHIEKYLCEYLNLEFSPGFAVLLQGEWGCGKTWFIKTFIEEYEKNKGKEDIKNVLYISLYAVNSTNEIEDQIFQQLHPVLSSKPMALTGKILKGVLHASLKIDLNVNNQTNGTINAKMPELNLPDYLVKTDDSVLIFDDLERCRIPIEDVFGYINSFVEHQGLKVVIIANEDELNNIEKEKGKDCPNYYRIKEKLIGKTFRVSHDIESALNSFVEKIKDPKAKNLLDLNKDKVIEIFYIANYKNLRHLTQSIWDFERFFSYIPQKYKDIPELMVDLLSVFLSFSFEIKRGKIIPTQINKLTSILARKLSLGNKKEKYIPTPMEEVIDKYSFLNTYDTVLTEKCWRELFDHGYLSKEDLSDSLEKSSYCQDENTADWVKLWHFRELDPIFRR